MLALQADVREPKQLQDAVAITIEKFGRIDFVICGMFRHLCSNCARSDWSDQGLPEIFWHLLVLFRRTPLRLLLVLIWPVKILFVVRGGMLTCSLIH